MLRSTIRTIGDIAAVNMDSTIAREAEGHIGHEILLPPAEAGTVTSATELNVPGTTLVEGDRIDIYWASGRHWSAQVGAVSGDSVPITIGSGDTIPPASTPITVCKQTEIDTDFSGDLAVMMGALSQFRGRCNINETGAVLALGLDLGPNDLWLWTDTSANPLAGATVDALTVSHDSLVTGSFKFGVLYDSTV